MGNQWVISWLVIDYCRWLMNSRWLIKDKMFCGLLITHQWHWLVIDYLLITHLYRLFHQLLVVIWRNTLFFIEMMFTCKWSYNAGETDSSKRTHKLSPLRHANKAVLSTNTFHFELYIIINFVMITKQLNDNNIAVKMLSLMHIKKLNGVLFSAVAVYLQRKPAWTLECCCSRQLQYIAALQLALSLSCSYNRSTRGIVSRIPLSFNNSFKTASVKFSAGPRFIHLYFSCFSLFAASLSFFSWHSSHSQCPSISASVLLLREECHLVMELVEFSGWTDENQG